MKLPLPRKPACRFLVCFAFWYATILFSWPLIGQAYCSAFRAVGTALYGENSSVKEIGFEPFNQTYHSHYTRVVIVNPARMNPDGSGPVRNLDLDTRAMGWMPLAFLLALVMAAPLPWSRRRPALFWGVLWQQTFVFIALGYCIWNDSSEVGLVSLSESWKRAAEAVKSMLAGQLIVAIPILIWLLVTFRRADLPKMTRPV